MKEYRFKVSFGEGRYANGEYTVSADNKDNATDIALSEICTKLNSVFPELDIEVSVELIETKSKRLRNITLEEFKNLKKGNIVFVKCYNQYVKATVEDNSFYNTDADEPGWEVETSYGSISIDSVYIND